MSNQRKAYQEFLNRLEEEKLSVLASAYFEALDARFDALANGVSWKPAPKAKMQEVRRHVQHLRRLRRLDQHGPESGFRFIVEPRVHGFSSLADLTSVRLRGCMSRRSERLAKQLHDEVQTCSTLARFAAELTEWEQSLSDQERHALRDEGQLHGDLWYAISTEWSHGVFCFYAGWKAAQAGCIDHAKAAEQFADAAYDLAEERYLAARDFRKGYLRRCDWADRALVPTVLRREPATSLAYEWGDFVVRR